MICMRKDCKKRATFIDTLKICNVDMDVKFCEEHKNEFQENLNQLNKLKEAIKNE